MNPEAGYIYERLGPVGKRGAWPARRKPLSVVVRGGRLFVCEKTAAVYGARKITDAKINFVNVRQQPNEHVSCGRVRDK